MGSGNMITLIHFTPEVQGTFIEYHGTFKALQPTYENEMDVRKYNEHNLKVTLKWSISRTICQMLECCKCQHQRV